MIRTLHIIGYGTAALAAVLVLGFFFYGYKPIDKATEEFLAAPTVVETFDKNRQAPSGTEQSPLVKQAAAFALFLNPPPPPEPVRTEKNAGEVMRPVEVAPQFNLLGISYFASQPERSIALIDEPGKGINWIRQGGKVQQYTITKINESSVELTSGSRKTELRVPQARPNPLVKQSAVKAAAPQVQPQPVMQPAAAEAVQEMPLSSPEEQAQAQAQAEEMPAPPENPELAQKQLDLMNEFMKKMEEAEAGGKEITDEQRQAITEEFNKKMEELTAQEANQLQNLGQQLQKEAEVPPVPPPMVAPPPMPKPSESSNSVPAASKPLKSSRSLRRPRNN